MDESIKVVTIALHITDLAVITMQQKAENRMAYLCGILKNKWSEKLSDRSWTKMTTGTSSPEYIKSQKNQLADKQAIQAITYLNFSRY